MIKPAWLLLENIVQDEIGHIQYGVFAALYALGFLFITLSDLGINMYTTKNIAGKSESLRSIFSNAIALKLILSIVYPLFMVLVGYILGYTNRELIFLFVLSFTQAILQILLFFRSNFQAKQHFRLDSVVSVSDKAILMLIILFLLNYRLTLETYIYSRLISATITIILFYLVVLKLYGWIRPSFNILKIKEILVLSIPFAIMTILYSFNEKIDQVMLERMGEPVLARLRSGLYAGAYRWLDAFQMYLWTILPFFFAKFAFHEKEGKKLQQVFEMGQVIAAVPMIFVSVFVFFFADKLFWLFDKSSAVELEVMAQTTKILFISALLNGFFAVYGSILACLGLEKRVSYYIVVSTILNIGLNLIFIPEYGTYAAAWSTVVSSIFLSVIYIWLIEKELTVNVPFLLLFRLLAAFVLLISCFYFLDFLGLKWYETSIVSGFFLLLLCVPLGLVKYMRLNETQ